MKEKNSQEQVITVIAPLDFAPFKCKITGGRIVTVIMPTQDFSMNDVARLFNFLQTQTDEGQWK